MANPHGIHPRTGPSEHGWTVTTVSETGSTNADMLAAIERGESVGSTVLRAEHQTAGRGRLDRRWEAPAGSNLLASLCFVDVPTEPVELTQAVGLAAVHAVESFSMHDGAEAADRSAVGLKWPNDVLVGDRKLAGVLAQRSALGPVVVGIGLNIGWAPDGAACVARDLGVDVDVSTLLDRLLVELDRHLALSSQDRRARYVDRLHTLGRTVHIERPGDVDLVGVAVGLDDRGRLLVEANGSIQAVDVGDIVHLRTPSHDQ